jgi:cellulose synthase/poly-beta-1,6-N-acetylglucosamine synthase-like glycosyltransferase
VTYEQEPERWDVWLRQRTRWVRGNNYVAKKFFGLRKDIKSTRLRIEILYLFAMYYIFFVAILMSDFIFLLTATRLVSIPLPGPYNMVWMLAVVLFFGEILLALSYDREDSPRAVWYMALMYFTYCQLWIVVVAKAFYLDVILKEKRVWVKTVRFKVKEH